VWREESDSWISVGKEASRIKAVIVPDHLASFQTIGRSSAKTAMLGIEILDHWIKHLAKECKFILIDRW
jgi:hypothetical protein